MFVLADEHNLAGGRTGLNLQESFANGKSEQSDITNWQQQAAASAAVMSCLAWGDGCRRRAVRYTPERKKKDRERKKVSMMQYHSRHLISPVRIFIPSKDSLFFSFLFPPPNRHRCIGGSPEHHHGSRAVLQYHITRACCTDYANACYRSPRTRRTNGPYTSSLRYAM